MLIDAHCHFNSLSETQQEEIISSYTSKFILIDSSINYSSSLASSSLSQKHTLIYSSLGFHPFWGKEFNPDLLKEYEKLIQANRKIVAIGEAGLDYKADIALEQQEDIFRQFILFSKKVNLPLVVHNRLDSYRILDILDDFFTSYEKVIFHCFSYPPSLLEEILKRKGLVSFSLNALRKKQDDSLKICPLENMLLETDSPYMKVKGRASNPFDIKKVYSFAASLKQVKEERLEETIFSNAKRIFSLPRQGSIH